MGFPSSSEEDNESGVGTQLEVSASGTFWKKKLKKEMFLECY